MVRRILIADPNIDPYRHLEQALDGIRHCDGERQEIEVLFATGAADALHQMMNNPVDVVMADRDLPAVDGLHLLDHVRALHPVCSRLLLTDRIDAKRFLVLRTMAHQVLVRPLQWEAVQQIVERSTMIRSLLRHPVLQQLVTKIGVLPTLPSARLELMQLLRQPNVSVRDVGRQLETDLSLSVEVLRLVNSAYFNLRQQVTEVQQAIVLLGLETVSALVQAAVTFSAMESAQNRALLQELYNHSVAVGQQAKQVAKQLGADRTSVQNAELGGMLHDIGKLIFCTYFPSDYFPTMLLAERTNRSLHQAEQQIFGVSHAELGAYLLGLWGFSDEIVLGVAFHHTPSRCGGTSDALTAVHVANGLQKSNLDESSFDFAYLQRAGYSHSPDCRCGETMLCARGWPGGADLGPGSAREAAR